LYTGIINHQSLFAKGTHRNNLIDAAGNMRCGAGTHIINTNGDNPACSGYPSQTQAGRTSMGGGV
jgi:hypothetical protein